MPHSHSPIVAGSKRRPRQLNLPAWRRSILGAVTGLLMLAGWGHAASLTTVDDFTITQSALTLTFPPAGTSASSSVSGAGILGGERDISINLTSGVIAGNTMTSVVSSGFFSYSQDATIAGNVTIKYDGINGSPTLDPTGLGGIDLTLGGKQTAFLMKVFFDDLPANYTLSVYTDATHASTLTGTLPGLIFSSTDYTFNFSDFAASLGTGADFTNVGALTLTFGSGVTAPDIVIDSFGFLALPASHWLGGTDNTWSGSNWASDAAGTATTLTPTSTDDITFSATGAANQVNTNLDADFTINSLTVNSATGISTAGTQTLTVNTITTLNSLLSVNSGVTLINNGTFTVDTAGTLAGSGAVQMDVNQNLMVNGALSVGDPSTAPGAATLSLTTSGTGAVVMGATSTILVDLFTGAGLGNNTGISTSADVLALHGTLNATAGGTLVIGNPNTMTGFAGGDQWKLVDLTTGSITGTLAVNDSAINFATGVSGSFDQATGIYSIIDIRPQLSAVTSGLSFANAEGQALISASQTATNDVNGHLFTLRAGGGEEEESDGSLAAAMDDGVIVGQGDGDSKNPIAKRVQRSRQWEVFTTVNYGNARLSPISNQAGVQIDSWASSVGIERHLSRSLILGFAATFLQSSQNYTSGLGHLDLEGPALSTYLSYVHKSFWSSLLYSFGDYDLGSTRNPGFGFPTASGSTRAYTNSVQYNTGWNFRSQDKTFVTGPFVGIDYLHGSVDGYTETGGGAAALSFARQTFQSLVTRVGWSVSKKIDTDFATITPQFRLSYERQNLNNNGTSVSLINAPFTAAGGNQNPGQDYMVIGGGVNFQFTPALSLLLSYQGQFFRNNMESHFGSVRLGYKF